MCGVIFAILTFTYTREYRSITAQVNTANTIMRQVNGLLGDLQEYNTKTARSADLAAILQPYVQTAPAVPAAPKTATPRHPLNVMAPNESSDPAVAAEPSEPSVSELKETVAALQRQFFSLLLAVIVVSGTLSLYLYRQASLTRKDLAALRNDRAAVQLVATFNQDRKGIQSLVEKLNDYAKTHRGRLSDLDALRLCRPADRRPQKVIQLRPASPAPHCGQ